MNGGVKTGPEKGLSHPHGIKGTTAEEKGKTVPIATSQFNPMGPQGDLSLPAPVRGKLLPVQNNSWKGRIGCSAW